jgi:glutamine amidotransferase
VAHVRHASTGALTQLNTHPFEQQGRLFAHNGVVEGLEQLDARLAELGALNLVQGDTDSERMFALITAETARHDGDLAAGLTAAIGWISDHVPVYSLNFVLITATELWALRYPALNELWILQRPPGGTDTQDGLEARTERIHARSNQLAERPSVVVASEPMDADPGWRLLQPGELVHIGPELQVAVTTPFPAQPRYPLTSADLTPTAAASQKSTP